MTLQDNLNLQQNFDLFSIFTGERIDAARPAIMEASTHPLYQQRTIVMVPDDVVEEALDSDATSKRIMSKGLAPALGDIVGIRLNLNLIKSKGVPVQTVHAGNRSGGYKRNKGLYNGSAIAYEKVVTLENAYFNVSQKGREDVASGTVSKFPLASVDGAFMDVAPDFRGWKSVLIRSVCGSFAIAKIGRSDLQNGPPSMPIASMSGAALSTTQKRQHQRKSVWRHAVSCSNLFYQAHLRGGLFSWRL